MNDEHSSMLMGSISEYAMMAGYAIQNAAASWEEWSILLKPRLFIDGDKWCALYGANIQDGIAGFGDSPAKAFENFNVNFITDLPKLQPMS